jgi:hypothetical protein
MNALTNALNGFGGGALDILVPGVLTTIGTQLKNKDANSTGADDCGGNALIALAPIVPAILHGNVKTQKQVVDAAIAALESYRTSLGGG